MIETDKLNKQKKLEKKWAKTDIDKWKEHFAIKGMVRDELSKILSENKSDFEDLRAAISPNRLKAEIRNIITYQIDNKLDELIKSNIQSELNHMLNKIEPYILELILEKTNNMNFSEIFKKQIDGMFVDKFSIIMKKAISVASYKSFRTISKHLKDISSLKTSTINEIKCNIDQAVDNEKKVLEEIDNSFIGDPLYLEYFKYQKEDNENENVTV